MLRRRLSRAAAPFAALLVLSVASAACPPKHPDPQAQQAQVAREVVMRLGELQSAAISASDAGALPPADAVKVVKFTTAAVRTVQQTPYGWAPTVTQAYGEVQREFGAHPRLQSFFLLIDAILGSL